MQKFIYCLLLCAAFANAQERPTSPPAMDAYALTAPPTIDGKVIGDSAWNGVTPANGFWQIRPDDGRPASQKTEVYVGFTDSHLYVGVVAYDDDPDSIIVTDSRRDSSLNNTDAFGSVVTGGRNSEYYVVPGTTQ